MPPSALPDNELISVSNLSFSQGQAGASRPFPWARKAFLTAQNLADLGHFLPELRPPSQDPIDDIQKTQKEWNGAGTFGFLVTLKKHEGCEKCRRRIVRIELAHRL